MDAREHLSQHEQADRHPLITDSAEVTRIEALDENRTSEIETAIVDLLREYDRADWIDRVVSRRSEHDEAAEIDWARLQTLVDDDPQTGPLGEFVATLWERYQRPFPSLLRIRFNPDTHIDFSPRQYVTVRYHDVPRPYSVASSPTEDEIEIAVRRVPGGDLTSELSVGLSEGDEAVLRGPYGHLLLEEPSQRDLVFLATGTGVAPIKSMIDYAFETGRDEYAGEKRHVWLFLGASWEDDLPYREPFRTLDDERENFHFVPTLSQEQLLTDWQGETAYVQYTFCKYLADDAVKPADLPERLRPYLRRKPRADVEARIEPGTIEVYTVGIGAMVSRLLDVVDLVGVDESHVHAESYG